MAHKSRQRSGRQRANKIRFMVINLALPPTALRLCQRTDKMPERETEAVPIQVAHKFFN